MSKVIAVDWDGVIADPLHPRLNAGALGFLVALQRAGYIVKVHSCRDVVDVIDMATRWGLLDYIHGVSNAKPSAFAYIDDRALCHRGDFRETLAALESFVPYWEAALPILTITETPEADRPTTAADARVMAQDELTAMAAVNAQAQAYETARSFREAARRLTDAAQHLDAGRFKAAWDIMRTIDQALIPAAPGVTRG